MDTKIGLLRFLLMMLFSYTVVIESSVSQIQQEWISKLNIYDGNETLVREMTVDIYGNVYVTGSCPVSLHGKDFVTVKYNSSGVQQWVSYYNGSASLNDAASCIDVDHAGNLFVAGSSYSENNLSDFLVIKYNSSGEQQWIQRYDGPGHLDDGINDISVDTEGSVYVTGGSWGIPGGLDGTQLDYATIKYSNNGVEQWVQRYNGKRSSWDESFKLGVDSESNIVVTGYSMEFSGQSDDFTTIKYNSSGAILWVSHFDGSYHSTDHAKSLTLDKNNNLYVMGFTPTVNDYDFAIIKYSPTGVQKWSAVYNGIASGWDYPISIADDTSGNIYVSGVSTGIGSNEDYLTVKYDSSGIYQWSARYNNSFNGADRLEGMVADKSGNVYVTGYSLRDPSTFNYLTIKYNTFGEQQWIEQFHEKGNIAEYGRAIAIDKNNNLYVSGYTFGNIPEDNIVTIKYSQLTSVNNTTSGLIKNFMLHQNFPNPFNPRTIINYELPEQSKGKSFYNVKLIVYNILGSEVAILFNSKQQAGKYSIEFDGSQYASGIYFYKIDADNYFEVKKMTLLK